MRLSVIMPCYNEAESLPDILNKVRAITIDKEIIVIDDCSSDDTPNVLANEQRNDPNLRVVRHERAPVERRLASQAEVVVTGRAEPVQEQDRRTGPLAAALAQLIEHLLGYVDPATLRPLKIVVNAGNGGAGLIVDQLAPHLPFDFIRIQHEPDGSFPHGIPNPLLPGNRGCSSGRYFFHRQCLPVINYCLSKAKT